MKLDLIKSHLKKECIDCCNINIQCTYCIFEKGGSVKKTYFTEYTLIRKSHLFFFLNNPNLLWTFPELPEYDFLNNHISEKQFTWVIHHEDGNHWNDNIWNHILCLNTEHRHFHNLDFNPMSDKNISRKAGISISKARKREIENGTHNFITNHPMKNPDIAKRCGETRKRRDLEGLNKYRTVQQQNILSWLNNLNNGTCEITKDLCSVFGYAEGNISFLKHLIEKVVIKDKLINYEFEHNNESTYKSQWFLKKGVKK